MRFEIISLRRGTYTNVYGEEKEELLAVLLFSEPFSPSSTIINHGFVLRVQGNKAALSIPVIKAGLKYFFPDYKNYYYLPDEDMCIHRSVAEFVDKAHKKKAARDTAYVRLEGEFIPCPSDDGTKKLFKSSFSSKELYLPLEEMPDASYINEVLELLLPSPGTASGQTRQERQEG